MHLGSDFFPVPEHDAPLQLVLLCADWTPVLRELKQEL